MFTKIYQFKVTLRDISPPIWRLIQVPANYSFWDFHVAIQDAMGWLDCHLHIFKCKDKKEEETVAIGIPDPDGYGENQILPGWKKSIRDYFTEAGDGCEYEYDFGDGWEHEIILEKIIEKEKGSKLPRCIDGKRACPPEDCGGPPGYDDLINIFSGPKNDSYKEMVDWLGRVYEPEKFNVFEIKFEDPQERFRKAFE
jgi:prepilin-type processing-associated H-X9-DG protein